MPLRVAVRLVGVTLVMTLTAPAALGYIHFPPMTLPKMCKISHQIRVMKVAKHDKDKGVIVFEVASLLKGEKSQIASFKHVIRPGAEGVKPILDWVKDGRSAVMFSVESKPGGATRALGYVFIDHYCYSVDYDRDGKYWLLIRGEPDLSACYHGPVERLREVIKDVLDGKEVKVPVKEPDTREDREKRFGEINDVLKRNR